MDVKILKMLPSLAGIALGLCVPTADATTVFQETVTYAGCLVATYCGTADPTIVNSFNMTLVLAPSYDFSTSIPNIPGTLYPASSTHPVADWQSLDIHWIVGGVDRTSFLPPLTYASINLNRAAPELSYIGAAFGSRPSQVSFFGFSEEIEYATGFAYINTQTLNKQFAISVDGKVVTLIGTPYVPPAVPEPATLWLSSAGLAALAWRRRRLRLS